MKQKSIVIVILMIILTGCASLNGPKKPPKCNGQHTRALNKDKWDWANKNVILPEKIIRPVTTPIILNTLESEKAAANTVLNTTSLNPVSHKTLSNKTVEVSREK
ncbi:hypothetical protein [Bartonella doshiae]|uniref:Type IV secretion system protein VirB7 n=2 Tax=Bartonella doshiae TaxID=33044 RepID=A0A380ZEM4_BARDO|nr:hypothetical protein [Bartonella doshiae]EJF78994.1 hypothetical protein MCS_01540 [Bartonella doshiae NCTC 12862 = ATCC 700133]MBB6159894.1 hypothetical protein [Bartonella doshiae]SUV45428.1 Uncharacterised protein [Bartonella doshiae]